MEGRDLMEDPGSKPDAGRPKVVLAAWRLAIMAGPRKSIDVVEVDLRLRLGRHSWPQIARATRLGQGTLYRAYRKAIDALKPFQNAKAAKLTTTANDES